MLMDQLADFVLCGIFVLSPSFLAFAQIPTMPPFHDVKICELVKNPMAFNKQMIRFRGRLNFEFEGDVVDDNSCGLPLYHTAVWWSYGGGPLPVSPREIRFVQTEVSPIIRDEQFQKFERYAQLGRTQLPNGNRCPSFRECRYYDVVATFSGRFFATERPKQRAFGGYGHMGCCYLFVVEQISDVAVQRTPVPSDDQAFSCTTTMWQSEYPGTTVSGIDERVDRNRQFLMDQARSHGDALLADKMKTAHPWQFVGLTGWLIWSSPDLLTTYTAQFPPTHLQKERHKQADPQPTVPLLMNVSKEQCEPAAN